MRSVRVDAAARRAHVGPGAVWADVDHETQAHALATTGGLVSTTGVAGFTLGGGIGWLMRRYGLACDNLVGADVVTADGRLVHASEDENGDLRTQNVLDNLIYRREIPVMAPGREDVIPAGAAILVAAMQRWGFTEALVSETDILDGIAYRMVEPTASR